MSRNILVTGAAGFIGANFAEFFVNKHPEYNIIVLDKLTYAGNLDNIKKVEDKITFVKGDICEYEFIKELFEKYKFGENIEVIYGLLEKNLDEQSKKTILDAKQKLLGVTKQDREVRIPEDKTVEER